MSSPSDKEILATAVGIMSKYSDTFHALRINEDLEMMCLQSANAMGTSDSIYVPYPSGESPKHKGRVSKRRYENIIYNRWLRMMRSKETFNLNE